MYYKGIINYMIINYYIIKNNVVIKLYGAILICIIDNINVI